MNKKTDTARRGLKVPNWQEAEKLPDGAVLRTASGEIAEAFTEPLPQRRMWGLVGIGTNFWSEDLKYPAELIWHPEFGTKEF